MNVSKTHGENDHSSKKNLNPRTKNNLLNKNNITAKVVKNNSTVYSRPNIITPSDSKNVVNEIVNNLLRVTIVGVGMAILSGTFLANRDLTKPLFPRINLPYIEKMFPPQETAKKSPPVEKETTVSKEESKPNTTENKLTITTEDTSLKEKLKSLQAKYTNANIEASSFFMDLDTGVYVNVNGGKPFPAASTIKIPVFIAFLQDVDAGKISLDEKLKTTKTNMVSGSGGMQYQGVGKEYTVIHTATEMIISSDNTATEMIIERLGGKEALNQRFKEWGLENTVIKNILPDLAGTNLTTAKDLAMLLAKVNQGELISDRSRDRLFDIMTKTKTRTLLPQGVEEGTMIAHKTGDIGKMIGDAGIIDMPTGKRYVGAVLVTRPHNDVKGRTYIQEISRTVYQHFKSSQPQDHNGTL